MAPSSEPSRVLPAAQCCVRIGIYFDFEVGASPEKGRRLHDRSAKLYCSGGCDCSGVLHERSTNYGLTADWLLATHKRRARSLVDKRFEVQILDLCV